MFPSHDVSQSRYGQRGWGPPQDHEGVLESRAAKLVRLIQTIKYDKMLGDLEGTVEEIGWKVGRQDVLGTDPVVDTDARVVEVKISLDHRSSAKVNRLTNLKVNVIIHPN